VVGVSKAGAPRTTDLVDDLLALFERYQRGKNRTYKQFLKDHKSACDVCGIKSYGALRDAIYRARRRRVQLEALIQFESMRLFGVKQGGILGPRQD
jgi:hypothetical protein